MNEAFYSLPQEKQLAIFNACMEVFGAYDYQKASTDLIAAKAGVSKGLLFYYFHNKKELYMKTYEYVSQILKDELCDSHLAEITDFFELLSYGTQKKLQLLSRNPHLLPFSMRAFYSMHQPVSDDVHTKLIRGLDQSYQLYFQNLDMSKFQDGISPLQIFNMLLWMTDGYLHIRDMAGLPVDLDDIDRKFNLWCQMLKKVSYKEEYQ